MKYNNKHHFSINSKLIISFVLLQIVLSVVLFLYLPYGIKQQKLDELHTEANELAWSLVDSYDDSKGINKDLADDMFRIIKPTKYLIITANDSTCFDHMQFYSKFKEFSNHNNLSIIIEGRAPLALSDTLVGELVVGLSTASLNLSINELSYTLAIILITILGITTFIFVLISIKYLRPLSKFVKAVDRNNIDEKPQQIFLSTHGEIDFIVESYNNLTEVVISNDKEMDRITRELENRVKERTKELENALDSLKKENKFRKDAELAISKSLHEKEILLKEIHHRVKNNLQIVSSLFFFQSKQISDLTTLEMFRDGQNRVKSMALIHEKLYQSGDLANINFKDYVKKLTNFLFQSYGVSQSKIKLKNYVQQVELGVDTAVPCGLIINELISNSLKHAFKENDTGEIRIDMGFDENNKLLLIISDNGNGMPEDFNVDQSDSLGLRLVNNLTVQLNGKVEFLNNNGTTVRFVFPYNNVKKAS